MNSRLLIYALAIAAAALVPVFAGNDYIILIGCLIGIYIIVNTGLDMVYGYSGQITLGQAGFYAIGAYTSALLSINTDIPVLLCVLIAGLLSSVIGMIVAFPAVKLVHHFLAMVTIGFGEIIRLLALNGGHVTGGVEGISNIPKPELLGFVFGDVHSYFYLVLVLVVLLLWGKQNLVTSRIGRSFRAIRDNPSAASAFGINVHHTKVAAFTVEGFFGGVGGALYAHLVGFISPETFTLTQSVLFLTMVLLGGAGTFWGPIIGTVLITILFELLQPFGQMQMAIYGLIIMGVMLFMPKGIMGMVNGRWGSGAAPARRLATGARSS